MSLADEVFGGSNGLPSIPVVSKNLGGGGNSLFGAASGVLGSLAGPGGMFGALMSGGLLSGGLSPSSSAQGGPVSATGWGALNNPFIIASGSARVDSRAEQDARASLDTKQGGPSMAGPAAPLLSGDIPFVAIAACGLVALIVIKALRKA